MTKVPSLALVAWAALGTCAWTAEFPYTAYVTADHADVHSGPGENYYSVLKLRRGAAVEVYRHDRDGWYAIRPPEGAFSWVSAEFVEPGDDGMGIVKGNRVAARVGTKFDDTRDVIQVRLDHGEEVQILEAREFDAGSGVQTWYKIAPPRGEFRWISRKFVEAGSLTNEAPKPSKEHKRRLAKTNRHPRRHWKDLDEAAAGEGDEVHQVAHEEPADHASVRGRKHRQPDHDHPEELEDPSSDDGPLPFPVRSFLAHRKPQTDLKEEAAELDLALSAIVAEETGDWDFTILRRQADAALARAETGVDRGHIRRVLRKIDNFAEIQQRYAALTRHAEGRDRGDRVRRRQNSSDSPRSSSLVDRDREPRFDGEGRLAQITTVDPSAPQFALLDGSGQVVTYVSPAPGINLRRYLNQEVGVHGTRSFLADRQARHLTARRIEALGDSRWR